MDLFAASILEVAYSQKHTSPAGNDEATRDLEQTDRTYHSWHSYQFSSLAVGRKHI